MSKLSLMGVGSLIVGGAIGGCSVIGEQKVQNPYGTVVIDIEPEKVNEDVSRDKDIANGLAYVCRADDYKEADLDKIVEGCVGGEGDDDGDGGGVIFSRCSVEELRKISKITECSKTDGYMECTSRLMVIQSEIIGVFGDMFAPCAREVVGWEETRKGCDVSCVDDAIARKLGRGELGREYSGARSECLEILRDCLERDEE